MPDKTQKSSLLQYFGNPVLPLNDFTLMERHLKSIQLREIIERPARSHCYPLDESQGFKSMVDFVAKIAGSSELISEIYCPENVYPEYTDDKGLTYAVPLTTDAAITVNGTSIQVEQWGVYSFDDSMPHTTRGAFLMIRLKEEDAKEIKAKKERAN